MITAEDLDSEQAYRRDVHCRHLRHFHGWGVVEGLEVAAVVDAEGRPVPFELSIGAGYAVAPNGDEIVVDSPQRVDVRALGVRSGRTQLTVRYAVELVDPTPNPSAEGLSFLGRLDGWEFVLGDPVVDEERLALASIEISVPGLIEVVRLGPRRIGAQRLGHGRS
jgi:hypothetical protein